MRRGSPSSVSYTHLDTLATTLMNNGVFIFTGKVNQPLAAYLMLENGGGVVPLILENVNFMVNISSTGALIQGGKQQEIFNLFSRNNMKLLQTQNRIQQEFQQAEQTGNKNRMQTLRKQFEDCLLYTSLRHILGMKIRVGRIYVLGGLQLNQLIPTNCFIKDIKKEVVILLQHVLSISIIFLRW